MKTLPPPYETDLYPHAEICPGKPDCIHDEDEEELTPIEALRMIYLAYKLAEKSTPANLRRTILAMLPLIGK